MAAPSEFWLDGRRTGTLPLPDRGLDFGDGLFETLLLCHGQPQHPVLHLRRLQEGLATLQFPPCVALVEQHLEAALRDYRRDAAPWAALRVTVTRGAGPRGYAPPESAQPRVLVGVTALSADPRQPLPPARLAVASIAWPRQPALASLKHLNRLEQVLAAHQAQQQGVDEVIMLDQEGQVVSCSSANLFAVCDGTILTPPIADSGIAGTRRRLILEHWAPRLGLPATEARLTLDALHRASELFICNSLVGLRAVAELGDTRWCSHPVCEALFTEYRSELG